MTIYYLLKENNKQYVDLLIELFPTNIIVKTDLKGIDKDNDIVIIQSISFLKPVLFMKFKNVYYFNIEQMTIYTDYLQNKANGFIPQRVLKNILHQYFKLDKEYFDNGAYKLLDYSKENVLIWKNELGRDVSGILEPYYPLQKQITLQHKKIDYLSLVNHDYRPKFIDQYLPNIKKNIQNFLGYFGEDRRNILASTKILINIHTGENFRVGELFRVNEAIAHKVIVISQNCYRNDLLSLSDYIIFCNDDEMEAKCREVLNNYEMYFNKLFSDSGNGDGDENNKNVSRLENIILDIKKNNETLLGNLS
jgi:hypothetical protein